MWSYHIVKHNFAIYNVYNPKHSYQRIFAYTNELYISLLIYTQEATTSRCILSSHFLQIRYCCTATITENRVVLSFDTEMYSYSLPL